MQLMAAQSTSVMCPSVDPLVTLVPHTTQSTEYEQVSVAVDQVAHACLGHEGVKRRRR
jgi:hypothetical protein